MKYKYYLSNSYNPYYNLAYENYLFDYVRDGEVILFLWQNENTIVLGKNQIIQNECNVDEFLEGNGNIARRMSGGGAVYHDLGNQNFSLISKSRDKDNVNFYEDISKALALLEIKTEFNGKNDILVNGKKFSGNAFYDNGMVYCQHGTLLVNSNIETMNFFLTPNKEKLERNGVKSVSSRVINLADISSDLSVDTVRKVIISATNAEPLELEIVEEELQKRINFFSNENWIYGGQK